MESSSLDMVMSIPDYFAEQSILITGATGLMGKVLVEKILRSCPEIARVILLVRSQKGVSIQERWEKSTQIPLFERLKKERPDALKKQVTLIEGDVGLDGLGMSEEDKKLLENEVTLVYHVAALIQFSNSVTDALHMNVLGTKRVLDLARGFSKLKVFVHVSTSYSNAIKPSEETAEEVLPSCQDWKVMLAMLDRYPILTETLKEKILCGHPNPYTWSKSIGEQVVNDYRCYFPIIIMRPAIVLGAIDDPISGWYDTTNAFVTVCTAIAYGVLRVMPTRPEYTLDFVAVDHAIKAFLIAPWRLQVTSNNNVENEEEKMRSVEVYNCSVAKTFPITHEQLLEFGREATEESPSENLVWISSLLFIPNWFLYRTAFIFLQVFPAAMVDLILQLRGKKTMTIRLTKRILNAMRLLYKIVNSNVVFPNDRYVELGTNLKPEDVKDFSYTVENRERGRTIKDIFLGYRKYFLKEDVSEKGIERSRARFNRIKLMHKVIKTVTYFLLGTLLAIYIF